MIRYLIKFASFLGCITIFFFLGYYCHHKLEERKEYGGSYTKIETSLSEPLETLCLNFGKETKEAIQKNVSLAKVYGRGHRTHPDNPGYSKCIILKDSINGKVKVSGGVSSHFRNYENKISFKIKLNNGEFLGMTKFTISNPRTNSYLDEWVFHQLNKELGGNYLFLDFIQYVENNEPKGIYSIEEHIAPSVFSRNLIPEGPVFRFDTDFIWMQNQGTHVIPDHQDIFRRGLIKPYLKSRLRNNKKQQELLSDLKVSLDKFSKGILRTHEVFDIQKLSSLFAAVDIMGTPHGIGLWNLKFYYNPKTKLIEPIPYDQGNIRTKNKIFYPGKMIYGESYPILDSIPNTHKLNFYELLFSDIKMQEAYLAKLSRITDEVFLSEFYKKIILQLNKKIAILQKDKYYENYSFEKSIKTLESNCKYIKQHVHPKLAPHVFGINDKEIMIRNTLNFPIVIEKITNKDLLIWEPSSQTIIQPHIKNEKAPTNFIKLDELKKSFIIHYKILGGNKVYETPIILEKENVSSFGSSIPKYDAGDTIFIEKTIEVGENQVLDIPSGSFIQFRNDGGIKCFGTLKLNNSRIDGNHQSIITIGEGGSIFCSNTIIKKGRLIIEGREGTKLFSSSSFLDSKGYAVRVKNSKVSFNKCCFTSENGKGVEVFNSEINFKQPEFRSLQDAILAENSILTINGGRFSVIDDAVFTSKNSLIISEAVSFIESNTFFKGENSVLSDFNSFIRKGTIVEKDLKSCTLFRNEIKYPDWSF